MKPIVKQTDYSIITNIIQSLPYYKKTKEVELMLEELKKAYIIPDDDIKADIIQMYSRFEVEDVDSKKTFTLSITPPEMADFKEKKISIFSPLAVGLFGYGKGMTVEWMLPGGFKKLYIKSVFLQQAVK
ncbi:MAG: transcription elongation factor GreAB [Flavobacterium sp.]|nr:MAG: transcription elongation factor GreAB [Flavobacterium sp.]